MRALSILSLTAISILLPGIASAGATDSTFETVLSTVSGIINSLIGLLVTLALVVFFWGLIRYLAGAGAEGSAAGLKIMLWGAIALFVMVSIWGLVKLVQNTFKVTDATITIPGGVPYSAPDGAAGGAAGGVKYNYDGTVNNDDNPRTPR